MATIAAATPEQRVRLVAGGLAIADLGMLAVLRRRPQLTVPLLGPSTGDLSTWSAGVIGTYTLAQAAIAARPSREGARLLMALRLVLIGGDVMLARRGRSVDRRWGVVTAIGNSLFALAAAHASRAFPAPAPAR